MGLAPMEAAVLTTLTEATSASAPRGMQGSTVRRRLTTAPPAPAPMVSTNNNKGLVFEMLSLHELNTHS